MAKINYTVLVDVEGIKFAFKALSRKEWMLMSNNQLSDEESKETVFDRLVSVEGLEDENGQPVTIEDFKASADTLPVWFVRKLSDGFIKKSVGVEEDAEKKA